MTAETITYDEVGEFLALAAARDQRTVGDADILAWYSDLNAGRVTLRAANAALTHYYAVISPKLDPERRHRINAPDLLAVIRKARADRLGTGTLVDDGDPDETPAQYLARKRAIEQAVADGRIAPPPALTAIGPAPANGPQPLGEDDIRALRQQADLARFMREGMATAKATCEQRKHLVLQHTDLAQQLTKAPMSLARPDCWNGFLPPERYDTGSINRSPVRAQLAALIAEAEKRATRRPSQTAA